MGDIVAREERRAQDQGPQHLESRKRNRSGQKRLTRNCPRDRRKTKKN